MSIWVQGRGSRWGRAAIRWARLLASGRPTPGVRVFYGHDRAPQPGEPVGGGTAKFQKLASRFANRPTDFSLLYLGSNRLPRDLGPLLRLAGRRGIPVVLNQDGVGYPGWAGSDTEAINRPIRRALLAADHVLYQSAFCKRSADVFVGEPRGTWEILPNAVDVDHFVPAKEPPVDGPVLLLGGDQTQAYRLELALQTLAVLLATYPDARLLVTGRLVVPIEPSAAKLGLARHVDVVGRYAQREAPGIFQRAHVLLHTKVNDPCPSLVLEAMASGLPVVHAASGGVVELVADEAGIGIPHPDDFERDEPPPAEAFADAVERVLAELDRYGDAARRRAVERYALGPWLNRHAELFESLLSAARSPSGPVADDSAS